MTAAERIPLLEMRARIVAAVRAFFDNRGFVEVETAVRIAAPAPEEHIDCPVVPPPSAPGVVGDRATSYLRASPELQMKKLLPRRRAWVAAQPRVHDARVVPPRRRLP